MPIDPDDLVLGGIYRTPTNQERLITSIENEKVHYLSRGGNVKSEWSHGSKKDGTKIDTFANACSEFLGVADVKAATPKRGR
jgi:hypothetical protein